MGRIIHNEENSIVIVEDDHTCVKRVYLPKCYDRLENEARCLNILNGHIAPKLISFNNERHELRMEYIEGLTLSQYVKKYGKIPRYYFAKVVKNLIELLNMGIEYGGDRKLDEHFIILEENENVRIIDFGLSYIVTGKSDIIDFCKRSYKKEFAFVFKDSNKDDIEKSKKDIYNELGYNGISKNIIDLYFNDYDKI